MANSQFQISQRIDDTFEIFICAQFSDGTFNIMFCFDLFNTDGSIALERTGFIDGLESLDFEDFSVDVEGLNLPYMGLNNPQLGLIRDVFRSNRDAIREGFEEVAAYPRDAKLECC